MTSAREARSAGISSTHDGRHHAGQHGKREHHGIHRDCISRGRSFGPSASSTSMPARARYQAEPGPARRDHEALRQHLAAPAARGWQPIAARTASSRLPCRRADDQQVGDVGARDQQDERHRTHQRHDSSAATSLTRSSNIGTT